MSDEPKAPAHGSTLAEQWQAFDRLILVPAKAGAVQRKETRRAFYAGAQALLEIMRTCISDDPDMTATDEKLIEQIDAEFVQFAKDIEGGRA